MSYRILLIEDNPLDINLFRQMLDQSGLPVSRFDIAENLASGTEAIGNNTPDIIFLDLALGDSEGIQTYHKIRSHAKNAAIVIYTANEDERMALDALRDGAQDYLLKSNISPVLVARSGIYAIERKRIEAELLRSKANNEALIENTKDGIWSIDLEMNITIMNTRFIQVMEFLGGKKPEKGKNALLCLPEKYHEWYHSLFRRALAGERFRDEAKLRFGNEDYFLELSVNPIRSAEGQINGASFFARDISQRKKSEEKIRKSEDAYRLLLQTINEGVMFVDNENLVRFANRKFIESTGYDESELIGKDFGKLLAETDPFFGKNIVAELLNNEDPKEIHFINKQGEPVWFSVKGTPLMEDDGTVGGTLLTHTEITDRKNAEQTIRKREQDYSNLLETMNEGLAYLNHEGKLKFANRKFEQLTGFSLEESLGKHLPGQIFPESLMKVLLEENSTYSADNPQHYQYEIPVTGKVGNKIFCMIGCSVTLDEQNQFIGLLVTYTDITDRKKTEEKLQVAQRELNTFIYRSSHDLKGPLSSILGLINVIEKEENITANSPCVKMIRQAATRLDRALNEMLNVVRIKREKIFPEPIDFYSQLNEVIVGLRGINDAFYDVKRNINIENKKPLRTDKKLLSLILHNLIDNAIKYRNKEADSYVTIDVQDYMHGVRITVEDNGIGFTSGTQENIFNMFNRGNYTNDGNGLGLYVVKNAIDRLGGQIELKCEQGATTRFSLFLPDLFSANQWVEEEQAVN
jgi:PAS domain S-box-containing protein